MRKNDNIVRATAEDMLAMAARGESRTDWAAAGSLSQAEVERLADEEDGPLPTGWAESVVLGTTARPKQGVYIRLEAEVLDWFKAGGPGYQTRINTVLRSFVAAKGGAETKR